MPQGAKGWLGCGCHVIAIIGLMLVLIITGVNFFDVLPWLVAGLIALIVAGIIWRARRVIAKVITGFLKLIWRLVSWLVLAIFAGLARLVRFINGTNQASVTDKKRATLNWVAFIGLCSMFCSWALFSLGNGMLVGATFAMFLVIIRQVWPKPNPPANGNGANGGHNP